MEKKIYYLSSCSTCRVILRDTQAEKKGFRLQDIKTEKITPAQLDKLQQLAGSYEALFSRRAVKYRELGLGNAPMSEEEYRRHLLDEYTFLKRPVVLVNNKIFIGSEMKTVTSLKKELGIR
jgi:arsenate reductase